MAANPRHIATQPADHGPDAAIGAAPATTGQADVGERPRVAGLVLAAGAGRRFGGPKALAVFRGRLLVEHCLALLCAGGCAPVHVVLGADAAEIAARADLGGAVVVDNPDWATGMGSSLRAGLASLGPAVPGAVVSLVDQPLIGAEAVRRLLAAHAAGAVAAVATYHDQPRNPVLLDRTVWPAVAATALADRGARRWLRANPDLVTRVDCTDTGTPADIDTPDDLTRLE